MHTRFSAGFVALSILCLSYVSANPVSLFIPGAEGDEPFTADLLGTDSTGHTTWRIGIGSASGSFTATDGAGAYPSVTLVEGSSEIHIVQAIATSGVTDPTVPTQAEQDCVYSTAGAAGAAICTIRLEAADETTTMVQTISGNVVEVQVAPTATGGGGSSQSTPTATGSGSAGSITQTASGGSVGASGTSSSGTAASTQTQSGQGNGAGKTGFVGISALVLVTLVNLLLL